MQNSGLIKFLTIVLVVVCVYELSFTFKSRGVEQEAREASNGNSAKYRELIKAKESEEVFNFIGISKYTYKECKEREINLGLDLRGGVSVTLEIALENLIQQKAGPNVEKADFKKVLAKAREMKFTSQDNFVELFAKAFSQLKDANEIQTSKFVSLIKNRGNADQLGDDATDEEVKAYLAKYADDAIDESFKVLRTRVAQFGIAQPSIKRVGNSGRIMVDLPGVEDIERVKRVLQGSAQLEFWDTYKPGEIYAGLEQLDKEAAAKELLTVANDKKDTAKVAASTAKVADGIDGIVNLGTVPADSNKAAKPDSLAKIQKDNKKEHPLLSLLAGDGQTLMVAISDTAKVHAYIADGKSRGLLPRNLEIGWSNDAIEGKGVNFHILWFLRGNLQDGTAGMKGDVIKRALGENNQITGAPVVSLDFNPSGITDWANMTRISAESRRPIAIVMDGLVFSAPVAEKEISGGGTQISGSADKNPNWNYDLATVLNAGRFPAPVHIVEEAYVGPSLGQEAIQAGVISFIVAILLVLVYMAFYYGQAGWIANVALFINMFLIAGVLAAFPTISLTLPGIAGIVLTVGMSVDANVLIFERIREELRAGKGLKLAIDDGYKHAMTAIVDTNLTTTITGLILWYFGSGVVEGFAQTLVIGVITSFFSAIFVSRLVFMALMKKDRVLTFGTKITNNFLVGVKYRIMENRRKAYIFSISITMIALIAFAVRGFDFGVDFTGGRSYTVRLDKSAAVDEIASSLSEQFVENGNKLTPEVKQYGGDNQFAITTKFLHGVTGDSASLAVQTALFNGLKGYIPANMSYQEFAGDNENKTVGIMNANTVGAEIADDIKVSALWAVTFSLLAIFLYVAFRFRKWSFGIGALVSLFHDVIIVMGVFSIFHGIFPFSLEINQHFIAALLTVLGYSIHDTVVVFDRIREYKGLYPKKDPVTLTNEALNSTFGRTINTSMTIFVVLLAIFIFGGETIRGFSFALLIGIVIGTYSSLFVATPIFVDLELKALKKKDE
ncbi:MAG: protein translocase subunit SecDF [Bacteroidetes bacterium]|nr:protein translocase subunit SecDF [Bacteroidota bacterium]